MSRRSSVSAAMTTTVVRRHGRLPHVAVLAALLLPVAVPVSLSAADWPAFLGPNGNGISAEKGIPTEWDRTKNVLWKTPLDGRGNGSPIVSAGRVFLTTATADGAKRTLRCFDRRDGKQLWERTVEWKANEPTHRTSPYAGTTPAADGKRVVVWHGSPGLFCYDFDGNVLWKRDLGEFIHIWGYGSSPVLHRGKVLLNAGPGARSFMVAVSLEDGRVLWQTDEPGGSSAGGTAGYVGSWSTPSIARIDGREFLLCSMSTRVNCYDLETGKIVWYCTGLENRPRGDLAYTSLILGDGFGVSMGGFNGPAIGFEFGGGDPAGTGDVTDAARLWRVNEGNPQRIGTGMLVGDHVYMANAGPSIVQCIEARTGKELWRARLPEGDAWASIVLADGLLYATSQNPSTVVFRPDPGKFDVVATNKLAENCNATPAISDGRVFIRTDDHLWCIGETASKR